MHLETAVLRHALTLGYRRNTSHFLNLPACAAVRLRCLGAGLRVGLVVPYMEQYNEQSHKLFFGNANVKRFKALVMMSCSQVALVLAISVS